MSKNQKNRVIQEDEIDLVELAKIIWSKRIFILKVTAVFVVLGLLIAFTSKVEYEASCKLMPESQEGARNNLGGLSGLAGLAGIDLGLGGTGSLTPELYPEIVKSIPFQLDLIHQPVRFEKIDSTISSYYYFKEVDRPSLFGWIEEFTIGLPGKIKGLFFVSSDVTSALNQGELISLTKDDWELIEEYKNRVNVSVSKETGVITISMEMPDPYAAAKGTDILVKKLTEEVKNYKSEKAMVNLEFMLDLYREAKAEYEEKQRVLARFTDGNKNITSSIVQNEYQRLQNEMNIAFEVYKGLATQLEQAKIKVKEETPVFTVLEPVKIPVEKSSPKRKLIVFISGFLGIFFAVGYSILKFIIFSSI